MLRLPLKIIHNNDSPVPEIISTPGFSSTLGLEDMKCGKWGSRRFSLDKSYKFSFGDPSSGLSTSNLVT